MGTSPWRLRGSDEYPKGQQRSLLTDMTANDPGEGWDGVNMSGPHPNKLKKKTVNASEGRVEGGALGRSGG